MGRFFAIAIPVFILGFGAGAAFWYLASPLFFDDVVSESLASDALKATRTGTFRDADRAHKGTGTATIFEDASGKAVLRFTEFEVTNGPDLEVWLVAEPDPKSSKDVKESTFLSLGQLKGNVGDQNYDIPEGTDLAQYGSVVIWCEQFGVLFSPAMLN
ncbi:MAG: DM13 domain-containing protein [Pseudomonadota bacterium]